MHLEKALEALGKRFGLFQLLFFSLLCIPYVFQAVYLSYVFTAMRSEYRCFVPECESDAGLDAGDMDPPWLQFAVPAGQEGRCKRYVPHNNSSSTCRHEDFTAETQPCDRWIYPNKHLSIMTEWDITCYSGSEYQMTMVGTMNNVGRILGLPLLGYFSDRFGRRVALLTQIAVSGVLGLSRSFATEYVSFISLEFLDPIFYDGIGAAAFIMGMELIPTRLRGLWSALSHVVFALGLVMLGVLAWAVPYWRWLLRILYSAALVSLPALWLLPESVHWLESKGRTQDAQSVLRKAARMNNIKCDELDFDKVQHTAKLPEQDDCNKTSSTNSFSEEMKEMIQSKILLFRAFICCLTWILVMLVYDGLSVYSVSMSGNPYLNFILVVLVEVPASLIAWLLLTRLGRRLTLCAPLLLAALFCFAYHFLPADNAWYRVIDVMLAKLCVTIGFTVLYVLSAEVFPTKVRHFMYNFCSMMGRSGSMLAPQAPLLSVYLDSLPLFVFSCVMMVGAGLALCFPETSRSKLPDCVREAEAMGRKPPAARDA